MFASSLQLLRQLPVEIGFFAVRRTALDRFRVARGVLICVQRPLSDANVPCRVVNVGNREPVVSALLSDEREEYDSFGLLCNIFSGDRTGMHYRK